jgi:P4 family phage/plasmid primase-like protien
MSSKQFLDIFFKYSSRDTNTKVSHTSMEPPRQFRIDESHQSALLQEYCDLYTQGGSKLHFGEVLSTVRPLLIDIDISRAVQNEDSSGILMSLYDTEDLMHTVRVVQQIVEDVFDGVDRLDELQRCIYLEKPSYISRSRYKNGFHLHFPYLFCNNKVFEDNVFPRVSELVNQYYDHKYGYKDVLDDKVRVWLLYGSNKPNEEYRYTVKKVFDRGATEVGLESLIGYNDKCDSVEVVQCLLPIILSTQVMDRREVTSTIPLRQSHIFKVAVREDEDDLKVDYKENMETVKQLLPLISDKRAYDYHSWIRVGWAIRLSCGSSQESLQLWLDFSSRCNEKYDERHCIRVWATMKPRGITIGTIKHYARVDSPELYSALRVNKDSQLIQNCLSRTHYDIAIYMRHEFGDEFMCACYTKKEWYHFRNHRWEELDGTIDLLEYISNILVPMFIQQHQQIKVAGAAQGGNENPNEAVMKKYWKLITALKTVNFKASLVNECAQVFYVKNVKGKLNANPELICFKNGVFDFVERRFRPGVPSDYLTNQMPINYKFYDPYSPQMTAVNKYLREVFTDPELRYYWRVVTSGVFRGGNMDKKVYIWSGSGNNAKSMTQKILEDMLGPDYAKCLTPDVINSRTHAGQASPELSRSGNGVRQLFIQEPPKEVEINVDKLKQLSSNDKQFARDLYQSGKDANEITPMYKVTLSCNDLPDIRKADKATFERIRVLPFESTFTDKAPSDPVEQVKTKTYPIDRRFASKIPDLLEPLAYDLVQLFLETDGIPDYEPEKVKFATDQYQKCNDMIGLFISDEIVEAPGHVVTLSEMFIHYRNWYKLNTGNQHPQMTQREINDRLKNRMKVKTFDYHDIRLKSSDGLL